MNRFVRAVENLSKLSHFNLVTSPYQFFLTRLGSSYIVRRFKWRGRFHPRRCAVQTSHNFLNFSTLNRLITDVLSRVILSKEILHTPKELFLFNILFIFAYFLLFHLALCPGISLSLSLWSACYLTAFIYSLTGPVGQPLASRHEGTRVQSPGGNLCETGILL
jgi:hypothetical protein